jgi:hypothetical protein
MERLVGLGLSRYLSTYIKNFSAQKFQNWALNDLEFKEEIVQELVGIPPNLQVKKVTCNQIYAKIPWTRLGHDPIVLVADRIYIELEEPYELKPISSLVSKKNEQQQQQKKKGAPGFIERILDNIKFEVHEIQFKVKTLGKHRKNKYKLLPPIIFLHIRDIVIHSTNSKWQVVDLKEVHKVNARGEVLMFKEIHLGRVSISLLSKDTQNALALVDNIPVRVRVKTKKEYFRGVDGKVDCGRIISSETNRPKF